MHKIFITVLCIFLVIGCSPKKEIIPPTPNLLQSNNKVVIYQMMTRLFGNRKQVNKPYGTVEENGVGKFNDITEQALASLKDLGITHVWYTGVIEHALLTDYTKFGIPLDDADVVKGRAGSPYSIKDYYDVNPDLAVDVPNRMNEFEQLIDRTHGKGLKVLIDFVPNHVARAYKSDAKPNGVIDLGEEDDNSVGFKPSNNFYYLPGTTFQVPKDYIALGSDTLVPTRDQTFIEKPAKVTGNDQFTPSPGMYDWFEAVKLNYGVDIQNNRKTYFDPVPDTWIKMKDILVFWAEKKVDGFRCDMSEMVPVEFWNWAIPQVKTVNPEIIFVAEIYNPAQYRNYIHTGKFDFLYDKVQLYDTLRFLMAGKRSTIDIGVIQKSLEDINSNMLHFLENHDEQRIASRFFAGDPWKGVPAMVISAMIDQGPVMIYFGQEVGEPAIGDMGFQNIEKEGVTTKMDYWGVPELQKWVNEGKFDGGKLSDDQKKLRQFYSTILNIAQKNSAITQGENYDLTEHNIKSKNFGNDVHAFIRASEKEKFLIVSNFSGVKKPIKISIPPEVGDKLNLKADGVYLAKDLLWNEKEIKIESLNTEVELIPFSAYVFRLSE